MEKTDSGIHIFIKTPFHKEDERNIHLESQLFEMQQKGNSEQENAMRKILSFIECQRQKDIERDAWCENLEKQCKLKDVQLENMKLQLEDCKAQVKHLTEKVAQHCSIIEQDGTKNEQNEVYLSTNQFNKLSNEKHLSTNQFSKLSNENNLSPNQFNKLSNEKHLSTNQFSKLSNEDNLSTNQFNRLSIEKKDLERKGIISMLGDSVTISAGGYHNRDHPISFLRADDNNCFANFHVISQIDECDGYILFDFGPSRINLHSYLIRSNGEASSSYAHPKTWRIEGSNNKSEWHLLDRRVNDQSLNGRFYQNKFLCQHNNRGEKDSYRYIRYSQEENWLNDYRFNYRICLSYIELYGDVFNNN